MNSHILCLAKELQENAQDEAGAITKYTELLNHYKEMYEHCQDEAHKASLKKQMEQVIEFISDEQNHLNTLQSMYIELTHITPAKD